MTLVLGVGFPWDRSLLVGANLQEQGFTLRVIRVARSFIWLRRCTARTRRWYGLVVPGVKSAYDQ